ncbi:MAG: hypothetical protein NT024_03125 [Proteobacteria bacterium]|nr:hypothetical protein [Pseudomonadota bacterium]
MTNMIHEFDVVAFSALDLAVTEAFAKQAAIPALFPGMLDTVDKWLRDSGVAATGDNYALYDRFSPDGMRVRIGFPVAARFNDTEAVKCAALAPGRAAHVRHTGPYSGLPAAHSALNAWCTQQAHQLAGVSWEVYGDWCDDQSKLVTDLYFRLS